MIRELRGALHSLAEDRSFSSRRSAAEEGATGLASAQERHWRGDRHRDGTPSSVGGHSWASSVAVSGAAPPPPEGQQGRAPRPSRSGAATGGGVGGGSGKRYVGEDEEVEVESTEPLGARYLAPSGHDASLATSGAGEGALHEVRARADSGEWTRHASSRHSSGQASEGVTGHRSAAAPPSSRLRGGAAPRAVVHGNRQPAARGRGGASCASSTGSAAAAPSGPGAARGRRRSRDQGIARSRSRSRSAGGSGSGSGRGDAVEGSAWGNRAGPPQQGTTRVRPRPAAAPSAPFHEVGPHDSTTAASSRHGRSRSPLPHRVSREARALSAGYVVPSAEMQTLAQQVEALQRDVEARAAVERELQEVNEALRGRVEEYRAELASHQGQASQRESALARELEEARERAGTLQAQVDERGRELEVVTDEAAQMAQFIAERRGMAAAAAQATKRAKALEAEVERAREALQAVGREHDLLGGAGYADSTSVSDLALVLESGSKATLRADAFRASRCQRSAMATWRRTAARQRGLRALRHRAVANSDRRCLSWALSQWRVWARTERRCADIARDRLRHAAHASLRAWRHAAIVARTGSEAAARRQRQRVERCFRGWSEQARRTAAVDALVPSACSRLALVAAAGALRRLRSHAQACRLPPKQEATLTRRAVRHCLRRHVLAWRR